MLFDVQAALADIQNAPRPDRHPGATARPLPAWAQRVRRVAHVDRPRRIARPMAQSVRLGPARTERAGIQLNLAAMGTPAPQ